MNQIWTVGKWKHWSKTHDNKFIAVLVRCTCMTTWVSRMWVSRMYHHIFTHQFIHLYGMRECTYILLSWVSHFAIWPSGHFLFAKSTLLTMPLVNFVKTSSSHIAKLSTPHCLFHIVCAAQMLFKLPKKSFWIGCPILEVYSLAVETFLFGSFLFGEGVLGEGWGCGGEKGLRFTT